MFYQNWKLSLIAIIMIPLATFAAKNLGKRIRIRLMIFKREKTKEISKLVLQSKVVKMMNFKMLKMKRRKMTKLFGFLEKRSMFGEKKA